MSRSGGCRYCEWFADRKGRDGDCGTYVGTYLVHCVVLLGWV